MADDEVQYGVSKKLEAFIVAQIFSKVFIEPGSVAEGLFQQGPVGEAITQSVFKFSESWGLHASSV
jgi:hypothetical protein